MVAERLRKSLDSQGTLAVLRQGFEMVGVPGLRSAVAMCQFKPALAMNADLQARYAANRLRVLATVQIRANLMVKTRFSVLPACGGGPSQWGSHREPSLDGLDTSLPWQGASAPHLRRTKLFRG